MCSSWGNGPGWLHVPHSRALSWRSMAPMGREHHHSAGKAAVLWALYLLPHSWLWLRLACGHSDGFAGFPFFFQQVRSWGFCSQPQSSPLKLRSYPAHPLWCDVPAGTGQQTLRLPDPFFSPIAPMPPKSIQILFRCIQLCNQLITMQMYAAFPLHNVLFSFSFFFGNSALPVGVQSESRGAIWNPPSLGSPGRLELAPTPFRSLSTLAACVLPTVLCLPTQSRPLGPP